MKDKFLHHMLKEIHEQPEAIQKTLDKSAKILEEIALEFDNNTSTRLYITGSGTSYNAGLLAQNVISSLTNLPVSTIPASELPLWTPHQYQKNTVIIAISQSGESKDVLTAIREAASRGGRIIGISNSKNSTLLKKSDHAILTHAGLEEAITATKSFTATLSVIYLFSFLIAQDESMVDKLLHQLKTIPSLLRERVLSLDDRISEIAKKYVDNRVFFILGSGPNYAISLEGALKLKESCNLFVEGFATREFLHGPLQLVRENTPLIILSTKNDQNIVKDLIDNFSYYKAPVISISQTKFLHNKYKIEDILIAENIDSVLTPLLYIIPLQLLAYYSSILRGLNPDRPEKLSKVVST